MITKKVSIIIATHDRAELLPRAIESLLIQTYQNFEIIIVDDASQDDTPTVIEKLTQSDSRIRAIRSDINIGPGAARNMGVDQATGEYIAILDDDDLASPERLEVQVGVMETNPDIDMVFSSVEYINDDKKCFQISPDLIYKGQFPESSHAVFKLLYVERNYIVNTTIMTRHRLWERFRYPEKPWIGEDRFLFCQLAASGIKMKAIPQPLVKVRRVADMKSLAINNDQNNYEQAIELVKMVKKWLKQEGITEFDPYYRMAISNRYVFGSDHNSGLKKVMLLMKALIYDFSNVKAKSVLRKIVTTFIKRIIGRKA